MSLDDSGALSGGPDWAKLERALGVNFEEQALLRRALLHRSFLNETSEPGLESYERLEYLGDAYLGWVVADELYKRFPTYSEGDLSYARAELVRNETLAAIAGDLDLASYIRMGQGALDSGNNERRSILAQALEAVLAAVLLDRGERSARALARRWFAKRISRLAVAGPPKDAKSTLQEIIQAQGCSLPTYETIERHGTEHAPQFRVIVYIEDKPLGEGMGTRKAEAEQAAASEALKRFNLG